MRTWIGPEVSSKSRGPPKASKKRSSKVAPGQDPGDAARSMVAQFASEEYSGPIPPPAMLPEFEAVSPGAAKQIPGAAKQILGAAKQILAQFEEQTRHRLSLEKKALDSDIGRSYAGLVAGFVVSMTAIVSGACRRFRTSWSGWDGCHSNRNRTRIGVRLRHRFSPQGAGSEVATNDSPLVAANSC